MPICAQRGDDEASRTLHGYREQLAAALNTAGWDGAWYRRAYYDNGQPIGSRDSDECQIDALAQAWAVISGVAPADRARMAMDAVEERLVDHEAGMIRLLTPAFNRTPNDPGYIKGYLPGIRENGGQYTHGVLWVVRALAEMGRGTQAVELLRMLSPVWHTATRRPQPTFIKRSRTSWRPTSTASRRTSAAAAGRGTPARPAGCFAWPMESIFGLSIDRGRTLVIKPAISRIVAALPVNLSLAG